MSKVFIKMVPQKSAQNKRAFVTNRRGKKDNVKESSAVKAHGKNGSAIFRFCVGQKKGGQLNTGFEKTMENPFKGKASEKLPSIWQNKNIETRDEITRQEYFEIKLGLEPGTLTSTSNKIFDKKPLPWIQNWWKDFQELTILDLDKPEDELTYWLLKQAHPDKCANSWEERTPFSRLYISQFNEDDLKVAKRQEKLETTIVNLADLKNNHSEADIRKVAVILNLIRGEVSIEKVKNTLSDFIMQKTSKQDDNIIAFNKLYNEMQDAKGREIFEAKYLLQECINNRIVSDYKGKYIWSSKKGEAVELLGKSYQEVINTFLDIDWRHYREELEEELKARVDDSRILAL